MALLDIQYSYYVKNIINIVRSLKIKSKQTARAMNLVLSALGDIIPDNERNWKYYKNLYGERYIGSSSNYSDPVMNIISLDTHTSIQFTKTTLKQHPITKADYQKKAKNYNRLLKRFPTQQLLIDGILFPIDINFALTADDHTILQYDKTLIESNELQLIEDLQQFIYRFTSRWNLPVYSLTDNLYPAAFLGILYLNLVPEIINIRLSYCKTERVHSYHLWNYLSGYFNIGNYRNSLPRDQALWLYRNIDYISKNGGKQNILTYLNTDFITPFGLTLYQYNIFQSKNNVITYLNNNELDNTWSTPYIERTKLNAVDKNKERSYVTTTDLVSKLTQQALLNKTNTITDIAKLDQIPLITDSGILPTGVLECNKAEALGKYIVNIVQEKIHNWLYLASRNHILYNLTLVFKQDIPNLTVTAKEAAAILLFCSEKYYGTTLTTINPILVRDILYIPNLTKNEITAVIEKQFLTGKIHIPHNDPIIWNRYDTIIDSLTLPRNIASLGEFIDHINNIINSKIQHFLLLGLETDSLGESELNFLIHMFYLNYNCDYVTDVTYSDLFTRLGVDFNTFNKDQLLYVINFISTNYIADDVDINDIDITYSNNVISILRSLTSYTLQFVNSEQGKDITPMDWNFMNLSLTNVVSSEIQRIWDGIDFLELESGFDNFKCLPKILFEREDNDPTGYGNILIDANLDLGLDFVDNLPIKERVTIFDYGVNPQLIEI